MTKKHRPVHWPDDCEQIMPDGKLCHHWGMFKMIRIDGSHKLFCMRHANETREQIESRPELFNPVRFVTVASGDLAANK